MLLGVLLSRTELDAFVELAWLVIAVVAGVLIHRVLYWVFARWAARSDGPLPSAIVRRSCRPAAYIIPLLAILVVIPALDVNGVWKDRTSHVTGLLVIAAIAWALIATARVFADVTMARHRLDVADNLLARQLGTRVDILTRVAVIVIAIVALGAMLMTFPTIRALGTTLLASAGLIGIVAGIAARPVFENLVAGVQLAFAQPIRLDDVVVVNGYWGKIEEIHMTYVVVQVWDLRRLVIPLSWFINNPFENWTRRTANLIGEVHVFADPTMDVAALRAEIPKILERTPLWDGAVQNCQVVDATAQSLDVRVLMSARNSGDLFDLRCFAREAIYAYLREHQPEAFPRTRLERIVAPEVAPEPHRGVGATTGAMTADGRSAPAVRTIKEG